MVRGGEVGCDGSGVLINLQLVHVKSFCSYYECIIINKLSHSDPSPCHPLEAFQIEMDIFYLYLCIARQHKCQSHIKVKYPIVNISGTLSQKRQPTAKLQISPFVAKDARERGELDQHYSITSRSKEKYTATATSYL